MRPLNANHYYLNGPNLTLTSDQQSKIIHILPTKSFISPHYNRKSISQTVFYSTTTTSNPVNSYYRTMTSVGSIVSGLLLTLLAGICNGTWAHVCLPYFSLADCQILFSSFLSTNGIKINKMMNRLLECSFLPACQFGCREG